MALQNHLIASCWIKEIINEGFRNSSPLGTFLEVPSDITFLLFFNLKKKKNWIQQTGLITNPYACHVVQFQQLFEVCRKHIKDVLCHSAQCFLQTMQGFVPILTLPPTSQDMSKTWEYSFYVEISKSMNHLLKPVSWRISTRCVK